MIEISNLKYSIKSNVVLDIDNLKLSDSGIIMITGPSGAGKSTLLHIISAILKPTEGIIKYNNNDIYNSVSYLNDYRKNVVGLGFQDNNLFDDMTVMENLNIYENCEEEINQYLEIFNLIEYKDTKIINLSSGEKRLIVIIRTLLKKANILLLDEPFENLDSDNLSILLELLKKISNNKLIILSSHSVDGTFNFADRVLFINNGKIQKQQLIRDKNRIKIPEETVILNKNFIHMVRTNNLKTNRFNYLISVVLLSICIFLLLISCSINFDFSRILLDTLNHEKINNLYVCDSFSSNEQKNDKDVIRYFYKDTPEYFYYDSSHNNEISSYYALGTVPIVFGHINSYIKGQIQYGGIPTREDEIIISSYSFDLAQKYGLKSINGDIYKPYNYEDIINKQFLYNDTPITIVGIYETNEKKYLNLKSDYTFALEKTILNKTTYERMIFFEDVDCTFYVTNDFDNYMTKNGFATKLTNSYYVFLKNDEIKDYIQKTNNIKPNFWNLIIKNDHISLHGTKYATATGYILTMPFIIISILKVMLIVWVILSICVVFYYIRSLYISNNKNISILFAIGFNKKDIVMLIYNTTLRFIISSCFGSLLLISLLCLVINNKITNEVGFYLRPFHVDAYIIVFFILVIFLVMLIILFLLKTSYCKRNELKNLKNN